MARQRGRGRSTAWPLPDGRLFASTDQGLIHCFAGTGRRRASGPRRRRAAQTSGRRTISRQRPRDPAAAASREGYLPRFGCGDGRLALELARRTKAADSAPWTTTRPSSRPPGDARRRRALWRAGDGSPGRSGHAALSRLLRRPGCLRPKRLEGDGAVRPRPQSSGSSGPAAAWPAWAAGGDAGVGPRAAGRRGPGPILRRAGQHGLLRRRAAAGPARHVLVPRHRPGDAQPARPRPGAAGGPAPDVRRGTRRPSRGEHLQRLDALGVSADGHPHAVSSGPSDGRGRHRQQFCLGGDRLFLQTGDRASALDATTGSRLAAWRAPAGPDGKPGRGDSWPAREHVFGSLANERHTVKESWRAFLGKLDMSELFSESTMLFAMDAHTGTLSWTYTPAFDPPQRDRHWRRPRVLDRPAACADRWTRRPEDGPQRKAPRPSCRGAA